MSQKQSRRIRKIENALKELSGQVISLRYGQSKQGWFSRLLSRRKDYHS